MVKLDNERSFLRVKLESKEENSRDGFKPYTNLVFLVDRSGSMGGRPIEDARMALHLGLDRLEHWHDVSAIVSFASDARTDAHPSRDHIRTRRAIAEVSAGGGTNMWEGMQEAIKVAKATSSKSSISKIILISDGAANEGPSSIGELTNLARTAAAEGISITTIGVGQGYNEELLTSISRVTDGAHYYAASSTQLGKIMESELAASSKTLVAKNIDIRVVATSNGAQPRLIGFEADVSDAVHWSTLYAKHRRFAIWEIPGTPEWAHVSVSHCTTAEDCKTIALRVEPSKDDQTLADALVAVSIAKNEQIMKQRDSGNIMGAKAALQEEAELLVQLGSSLGGDAASQLMQREQELKQTKDQMSEDAGEWNLQRKSMYAKSYRYGS